MIFFFKYFFTFTGEFSYNGICQHHGGNVASVCAKKKKVCSDALQRWITLSRWGNIWRFCLPMMQQELENISLSFPQLCREFLTEALAQLKSDQRWDDVYSIDYFCVNVRSSPRPHPSPFTLTLHPSPFNLKSLKLLFLIIHVVYLHTSVLERLVWRSGGRENEEDVSEKKVQTKPAGGSIH